MKFRLLATDPDPILLQIYKAYFPNVGFEVATAGDGLECLKLLREFRPDALILSLGLAWGGAEGILAIVRDETAMRPIPVVLTTDGIRPSKAVNLLLPPVVKLLEKPFRLQDLAAIIEAELQTRLERPVAEGIPSPGRFVGDDGRASDSDYSLTTPIQ